MTPAIEKGSSYRLRHKEIAVVRLLEKQHQIRWALLLALLMAGFAAPMRSQSSADNSGADPKPIANNGTQQTAQPLETNSAAKNSAPSSLEKLRLAKIEADTRKLYQLSAELRADVAKTYKESLSLTVLKKAQEIETLAKNLKVLMSKEAASNN